MHIPRTPTQIAADRARYQDHQRRGLNFAPKALPAPSPRPAPILDPKRVILQEVIAGGWYWTVTLKPGEVLRIEGAMGTSVSLAAWDAVDATERMNLPDTVKVQWTTELRKGRVIFSDMGRVLLSITEDSSGAHDALSGGSTAADVPQGVRNCRDNMVLAAAKLGLSRRDIPALWTLFAPVRVDAAGHLNWRGALLSGNDWVDLRAERPIKLALSNTRHPRDPATGPEPQITVTRLTALPVPADDLCRTASAEAMRGFDNNARGA